MDSHAKAQVRIGNGIRLIDHVGTGPVFLSGLGSWISFEVDLGVFVGFSFGDVFELVDAAFSWLEESEIGGGVVWFLEEFVEVGKGVEDGGTAG